MRFAAVSLSGNFSVALFCWKGESLTLQFRVIIPEKFTDSVSVHFGFQQCSCTGSSRNRRSVRVLQS